MEEWRFQLDSTLSTEGRGRSLPKISEFFGIAIYLYFDDHPPPHFHAQYAE
jgi:hypothetical protein